MKEKAALVGEKIRSVSSCSLYCSIIVYSGALPLFYFLIGHCTRPFHLLSFHILILISTCHGAHSPPSHPTPFTSSIDPINAIYFIFFNLLSFNLTPYASLPPFLTLPHRALSYLIPHIYQKNPKSINSSSTRMGSLGNDTPPTTRTSIGLALHVFPL
jgi:hypothetical protein